MKFTIIGSGGCVALPKPLCKCKICKEAREKGKHKWYFICRELIESIYSLKGNNLKFMDATSM